jgi:hypothetical protein
VPSRVPQANSRPQDSQVCVIIAERTITVRLDALSHMCVGSAGLSFNAPSFETPHGRTVNHERLKEEP